MTVLTSTRTYATLAALQAGDAVACAVPIAPIEKAFDDVGLAPELRPVIPFVKAAAAIGLLSVYRFPGLARLTTFMLTVYFVLAVGFHIKARDWSPGLVAASSFLGLYGAMTVKGPSVNRR
ncbi:DoxX family protein [Mycolicibacterium pyrenivorans]|uniref:DoxX family protein n=1 Tax=Mycolicibacterium pyrenivorans TaxID=187102 RepID=UPI0021F37B21|nr:DoxX family protein [Mycolicibacterium pyrenivorans]MCV7153123.1 DoxX family protein [Mycolicibacterium pyrenivorans]